MRSCSAFVWFKLRVISPKPILNSTRKIPPMASAARTILRRRASWNVSQVIVEIVFIFRLQVTGYRVQGATHCTLYPVTSLPAILRPHDLQEELFERDAAWCEGVQPRAARQRALRDRR